MIEQAQKSAQKTEDKFYVWEQNWQSVMVFCAMATQWQVLTGFAGVAYLGLDYQALESVMRMKRIKDRAKVFDDIRLMENAALEVLNKDK